MNVAVKALIYAGLVYLLMYTIAWSFERYEVVVFWFIPIYPLASWAPIVRTVGLVLAATVFVVTLVRSKQITIRSVRSGKH